MHGSEDRERSPPLKRNRRERRYPAESLMGLYVSSRALASHPLQKSRGFLGDLLVGHYVVAARLHSRYRGEVPLPCRKGVRDEAQDCAQDRPEDQPVDHEYQRRDEGIYET